MKRYLRELIQVVLIKTIGARTTKLFWLGGRIEKLLGVFDAKVYSAIAPSLLPLSVRLSDFVCTPTRCFLQTFSALCGSSGGEPEAVDLVHKSTSITHV